MIVLALLCLKAVGLLLNLYVGFCGCIRSYERAGERGETTGVVGEAAKKNDSGGEAKGDVVGAPTPSTTSGVVGADTMAASVQMSWDHNLRILGMQLD